jgi:hypothetical protein
MDILNRIRFTLRHAPKAPYKVSPAARPTVECPKGFVSMLASTVRVQADAFDVTLSTETEEDVGPYIETISAIVWLFRQSAPLKAHLLMSPMKKMLPGEGVVLGQMHVNSGYCYPGRIVVVYRAEEWRRTLIHECIHFYDLTHPIETLKFKHAPFVLLPEVHCEVWARLVLCCLDKGNLVQQIEAERMFACYQMIKVLDHNGMTFKDVLRWDLAHHKEKTNVFAYYIASAVLLSTFDYIKACDFLTASPDIISIFERVKHNMALERVAEVYFRDKENRSAWFSTLRFTS